LYGKHNMVINAHLDQFPPVKSDITVTPSILKLQENAKIEEKGTLKAAYTIPFKQLSKYMKKLFIENLKETILVTPSNYTSNIIAKTAGLRSIVIYPPIQQLEEYFKAGESPESKDAKLIVTMGRISPDKNLETFVEIASKTPKAKFYILGSTPTRNAEARQAYLKYFKYILDKIKEKNVDNITFKINTTLSERLEILRKASIYLHTAQNETLGRAIIEAMAAGLTPIVYRNGGPWTDVLEEKEGLYGYSYKRIDEAHAIINELIDKGRCIEDIERMRRYIKNKFSLVNVRRKWIKLISSVKRGTNS
ncbi:MAG: hypothetical protein DRJ60_05855, partial [Thermoprotei archaeon]